MRKRVKVWADNGEIDFDPTWLAPNKYEQLSILTDEDTYAAFVAAKEALEAAKTALIGRLAPPEALTPEELEDLKRDEVIG